MVVSEFKAKCIAVLREAQRTREAVLITRRGRPLPRVEPLGDGAHRGRTRIKEGVDLVNAGSEEDWEMLQ